MEYTLVIFYTILFLFLIRKLPFFRNSSISFKTLGILFLLKILAGISLGFVYTYYYKERSTADVFKYFDDSKIMYDALLTKPLDYFKMLFGFANDTPYFDHYYKAMNNWYRVYESNLYNESHTIIRLNAVFRIFSFGYYNVHTVFMCFLSFTGLVALYKTAVKNIEGKEMELVFGIFLLPSVLFWGSGVLKEGLLFFGIGMLVYFFFKMLERFSLIALFWVLFSMTLVYYTKLYILAIAIPILAAHLWCVKTNTKFSFLKYTIVMIVYFAIGFNLKYLFPSLDLTDMLVTKQRDFIGLAQSMNSGSLINIPTLEPNTWSLILNSPIAFFNTFFRPFIFESGSFLILMASIENFILLILTILSFAFFKKSVLKSSIFYACLFSVLLTFVLTGLITPVMGAIVRYKVPAMPFLMIFLIFIIDKEKLIKRFTFLKFLTKKP